MRQKSRLQALEQRRQAEPVRIVLNWSGTPSPVELGETVRYVDAFGSSEPVRIVLTYSDTGEEVSEL